MQSSSSNCLVSKRTKIRWSVRQLNFTEGDPEGENQLFIELDNPIEFTVFLKLRMQFSGMLCSHLSLAANLVGSFGAGKSPALKQCQILLLAYPSFSYHSHLL